MKAFDRIPGMKEIQALPEKVKSLEERIASLEAALARCPAEGCPYCGALAWRLGGVDMNGQREVWKCGECQKEREIRLDLLNRRPSGRR
jgi:transposase-like protein